MAIDDRRNRARMEIARQFDAALRHHRAGQLLQAERLYRDILTLDHAHLGSLHLAGVLAHQHGRGDAVELLSRAVALKPDFAEAHHDLGIVHGARGDLDAAARCFARAIDLKPNYTDAHGNLGAALMAKGCYAEAEVSLRRALAMRPAHPVALLHLGDALRAQGKLAEAEASYIRACQADTQFAPAHYALATLLKEQQRLEECVSHLQRATALVPHFAEAFSELGHALHALGRSDAALEHAERAVTINPRMAGARNNFGNILKDRGRLTEAIAQYREAVTIDPNFAPAHYNLGVALRGTSEIAAAKACFERALAIRPDFLPARFALCMAQLPILYDTEADIDVHRDAYATQLAELRDIVCQTPHPESLADVVGAHQPFYLAYQGRNDRALQACYGEIVGRVMASRVPAAHFPASPRADEPVRVGIVSGFFRHHSNWKIPIKGWLEQLDRRRFTVFGYHTGEATDAVTAAAAGLCARFVQGPLSLDSWRREIAQDSPHALLYPEVGMDRLGAQLAALRLAPLQCASWGHPETTGFPTIDYFLSSDLMEPADADEHYTERLVRLPNLSISYQPSDQSPPPGPGRIALGLRSDAIVYWCGQSLYKYLPQFDDVFPRIARAAGDCQFVFVRFPGSARVTGAFVDRLQRSFSSHGLDASAHCAVLPRMQPDEFVRAMAHADVMLDSIGWSGCNSILESLPHRLPVVTMTGALMRGRHATAILRMMDVDETITATTDDYVAVAARLGRDAAFRSAVREKMGQRSGRVYGDTECIAALQDFLEHAARRGPAPHTASAG